MSYVDDPQQREKLPARSGSSGPLFWRKVLGGLRRILGLDELSRVLGCNQSILLDVKTFGGGEEQIAVVEGLGVSRLSESC